ncbi:MAG TPA: PAS domain S-box protein [Polyangium sp.]|nr:PAS domain S-box protein [Polyangium sp.]
MTNTTQRFFDDGPDAICIADELFNVQHVNGAFEKLLGYTREELRGSPLWNIVEQSRREAAERVLRSIPPDGLKRVWPFIDRNGNPKSLAIHLIRSPSGSHLTTFREVVNDPGADRKRLSAERALSFLEYAPIPMYEVDGGGVISLWNSAMVSLFGISADEAIGKRQKDVLQFDVSDESLLEVQRNLSINGRAQYATWHQRRNGSPVHCDWTCVLMHDDVGKTLGVAITGIDLTETLRRESELQASMDTIRAQRDELRALSTPILEVWQNVLALPVIGNLDEARAGELMHSLLDAISTRDCRFAITCGG